MKNQTKGEALLARLRHHVTGAIERGEGEPILGIPARLAFDSPQYLRRLVRELNALPDGFYYPGDGMNIRCGRARFSKGNLEVRPLGNRGFRAIPLSTEFSDSYGRNVSASRTP